MIEGGWAYIWPAYAVTLGALAVLTAVVAARLLHWRKQARALDEAKRERAP